MMSAFWKKHGLSLVFVSFISGFFIWLGFMYVFFGLCSPYFRSDIEISAGMLGSMMIFGWGLTSGLIAVFLMKYKSKKEKKKNSHRS